MLLFNWIKYFNTSWLKKRCKIEWYNFYDVLVDIAWKFAGFYIFLLLELLYFFISQVLYYWPV